ncbi:ferredoxin-type protein NapF [Roseovarius phycicola]|uniref:Ferredoxin-type protein NapF n=1 Tax=Roseovarius phycicola TaxID=3080976 RepID=A0ABZ2HC99_9RHOB
MTHRPSRRAFLEARLAPDDKVRPPGATQDNFRDICTRCGDCAPVCPQSIIVSDDRGYPVLNLRKGGCTFCGACAEACPTEALDVTQLQVWPWRANIADTCFSRQAVTCRSCQDNCEAGAISFRLQLGGRAEPQIDDFNCTGCGDCVSICPAAAISLTQITDAAREATS